MVVHNRAVSRGGPLLRRLGLVLVLCVIGVCVWWAWSGSGDDAGYRTAPIARQDVRATVSATGTLDAVATVEVGTQVSGVIEELNVDFNDTVTAGEVLARIDPTLLAADVESARAALSLRYSEYEQASSVQDRLESLIADRAAAQQDVDSARSDKKVASAQVRAAKVALERAERNLGYATIVAPVDGKVVERDVEVGQTVNAGMTTPRLFLIAGDLARMQILASVDEADIGLVTAGQPVEFTVQAYPKDTFHGTVRQVRLQSTVVENVVTYTVVVDVDNTDGRLLPGMTATVSFIVANEPDVWCAPNAALRFRPADAEPAKGAAVWTENGTALQRVPVETGITNGTCTVVSGDGITDGMAVVTGLATASTTDKASKSPFQQPSSGGGRRGGGF